MATDVPMPKLGLTMEEAVIVQWLVAEGDMVEADQPIILIETDKTETEAGSPGAGRTRPIAADEDGGVVVRLGGTHRHVRVPIIPGSFDVLPIESIDVLPDGGSVRVDGPCVLAYDGERDRVLPAGAAAVITVSRTGPYVIDVARTLRAAAERHLFDAPAPSPLPESVPAPRPTEASHGH